MAFMQFQGPGFIMETPTDWLITSSAQFQVMFLGPQTGVVRPNLMVTIRPVEEGATAPQVAAEALAIQQREYPDYTLLEENDYTASGGLAFVRKYTWRSPEHDAYILQIQAFFIFSGAIFTLTATCLRDSDAALESTFNHMIRSFRFTR